MNPSRPHTAVINCRVEVHALDDMGQCSGQTLSPTSLEQVGLSDAFILSVEGVTAEDCLNKLKKKLEEFNAE